MAELYVHIKESPRVFKVSVQEPLNSCFSFVCFFVSLTFSHFLSPTPYAFLFEDNSTLFNFLLTPTCFSNNQTCYPRIPVPPYNPQVVISNQAYSHFVHMKCRLRSPKRMVNRPLTSLTRYCAFVVSFRRSSSPASSVLSFHPCLIK